MNTNRLAVIVEDGAVYTDSWCYVGLDLSQCNIPSDVHALQWQDNTGHIEYTDTRHNDDITELPDWAINCYNVAMEVPIDMYPDPAP